MLSLWALFLLSAMVMTWATDIGSRLAFSGKSNRLLEAQAMACSGAEVAMHPQAKPGSPVLEVRFGKDQSYEAHLSGEGGRLNPDPGGSGAFGSVTKIPREQRSRFGRAGPDD